jgi:hypothetical protein
MHFQAKPGTYRNIATQNILYSTGSIGIFAFDVNKNTRPLRRVFVFLGYGTSADG